MKRILSVQDLSCVGKCSLSIALPVLSAMGCSCTPLPTGILSSHTAFPNPHVRDLTDDLAPTCRHWQEIGAEFDTISIGYLANPKQVYALQSLLDMFPAQVVLDPVLGDNGKLYKNITPQHVDAMVALCEKADVLLPNVTEAALLTGIPYVQDPDMAYCQKLLDGLSRLGCKNAIITGVCLSPETIGFVGAEKGEVFSYQGSKCAGAHGTGDLFSAVFAGTITRGASLQTAAKKAANFVETVLAGQKEVSPFGLSFEKHLSSLWE